MKPEEIPEINDLYKKYSSVVDKNNPQKTIDEFSPHILNKISNINKIKNKCSEYLFEISKAIISCLKAYPEYEFQHKGLSCLTFSEYLIVSITRKIKFNEARKSLEEKNGGISITEYMQKRISQLRKTLKRINPDLNEESLIEEVCKELGVKNRATAIRYLNTLNSKTIDIENAAVTEKTAQPEKEYVSRETMIEKLRKIEAVWNKKPDKMLSELLTVCVLDMCDKMEKDDLYYDFIDRTILNDYFAQMNYRYYRFPEAQEIAEKHGYKDKSAATQKLKRFGKKIGIEFKYPRQSKKS